MIIEIETTKPPYIVGDVSIARMSISEIGFAQLASAVREASGNDAQANARKLFREKIRRQIKAYTAANAVVPLSDDIISGMPVQYVQAVKDGLGAAIDETPQGDPKLLSDPKADGIFSPIHIKLGRPIKTADGKLISELEFQAKTLMAIEDALLCDSQLDKVLELLKIARPVGGDFQLVALPSWAADQLSLVDGIFILRNVIPSFFGQGQD